MAAARALARNPSGGCRSQIAGLYKHLNEKEALMLGEAIMEAVKTPAPADSMSAGGAIISGIQLLSKHGIQEGLLLPFENRHRVNFLSKFNLSDLSYGMKQKLIQDIGVMHLIFGDDASEAIKGFNDRGNKELLRKMRKLKE